MTEAVEILGAKRTDQTRSEVGLADDPYAKAMLTTVGEVIQRYQKDGYPDKMMAKRPKATEKIETTNCSTLLKFWDRVLLKDVKPSMFDTYFRWRSNRVKTGATGRRSTDQELSTLANAMAWAHRCEVIRYNPMPVNRQCYNGEQFVKHCRIYAAPDADFLHSVAKRLMQWPGSKSEVLGFQMLVEALTGLRTQETLKLRADAKHGQPGFITEDWKYLHVARDKGQVNVNPFVVLHPALKDLIQALFAWKNRWYPENPYWFPSIHGGVVNNCSLGRRLAELGKVMEHKLTSHGMRAFYVKIRRSHGLADNQIAAEIGHESGGKTLVQVYGSVPLDWITGGGPKMSWLPDGDKPAWEYTGTAPPSNTGKKPTGWKPTPLPSARCDFAPAVAERSVLSLVVAGRKAGPQRRARKTSAPGPTEVQAGEAESAV